MFAPRRPQRRGWRGPARAGLVLLLLLVTAVCSPGPAVPDAQAAGTSTSNPIVAENQQPGSGEWQIPNNSGTAVADDTNNQIKGYASAASVNVGASITFYVTVNPSQTFTM